jgi:two-component system, cell cycle response regulator
MDQALLDRVLRSPRLPTLPAVAVRILDLTQDLDVSLTELASTIESDQALAVKVLRTVNSSFYGLRRPCSTINQAVVLLGLSSIKTLALSFCLVSELRRHAEGDFDYRGYWQRALYSAVAARLIAQEARIPGSDEAFLGALLQDVGMLALHQALGNAYCEIVAAAGEHSALGELEIGEFEIHHPDVGALLAQRWHLPDELIMPIKYHEQPTAAPAEHGPVVRAVGLANMACDALTSRNPAPDVQRFRACGEQWFGLAPESADELFHQIVAGAQEVSRLYLLDIGEAIDPRAVLARAQQQLARLSEYNQNYSADSSSLARLVSDSNDFDPLTGLLTRRAILSNAIHFFDAAEPRPGGFRQIGAIALEIDRFGSRISSTPQEHVDAFLVEAAAMLQQQVQIPGALLARWEGGTFAVLLPGADESGARAVADRLRQVLPRESRFALLAPGASPRTTWSAGVASCRVTSEQEGQPGLDLFAAALAALDSAKSCGGNATRGIPQRIAA